MEKVVQRVFGEHRLFLHKGPVDHTKFTTQEEIDALKEVVQKFKDKPDFVEKTMKWLGSVTASVAGRGLYEHIPAIIDFINKLIS